MSTTTPWLSGQSSGGGGGGGAVTVADGADVTLGAKADAAATTDTGTFSLIALIKRLLGKYSSATSNTDAARLAVGVQDGTLIAPASLTATGVLFTQDTVGFGGISLQVTSAGTTCTIVYEGSEDQVTWFNSPGSPVSSPGSNSIANSTIIGIFYFPRNTRYFRARVSVYGSGTVTVQGSLVKDARNATGSTGISGNPSIQGAVAHAGSATSNFPVKGAGRARGYGSSYAAVASDQIADLVTDLVGNLKVTKEYSYSNLAANATTTVKSGAGVLHTVTLNSKGVTNTATLYDNTAGSGTKVGTIDTTLGQATLYFDAAFATGLTVVLAGGTSADITVTYR